MSLFRSSCTIILIVALASCSQQAEKNEAKAPPVKEKTPVTLFTKLSSEHTGIDFQNNIQESYDMHYFKYNYLYMGAGVGVGDVNNDSLPDVYFSGNQVGDKLYLNKGDLKFEDITDKAFGELDYGWHTGVSMMDVNTDGWLDIYVCRAGPDPNKEKLTNLLYVNQQDGTFKEEASKWGLADTGHSTQALFFDHDGDGDLDVYVLNHPAEREPGSAKFTLNQVRQFVADGVATDRLYRNDGDRFIDITKEAGVLNYAYGLGVVAFDVNEDGRPDLYVSNDYAEPDILYVQQEDGSYRNEVAHRTKHVANFAMGVDVADINNDTHLDIAVLDMAYKSMVRSKQNMGSMAPEKFWGYINAGLHYQYMINNLQLNNGNGTFSEIAQLAGVAKTDWSWSVLMEDLDHDGWRDIYVTNGIKKDVRNNDAMNELRDMQARTQGKADLNEVMGVLPVNLKSNLAYRNGGDLAFRDMTKEWGLYDKSTSHGLAIADLDRDGDLDMVVNRQDAPSMVYKNNGPEGHYLRVALQGVPANPTGIGAKVNVHWKEGTSGAVVQSVRGYQSCMEPVPHFGFGEHNTPVDVQVYWPDGRYSEVHGVQVDHTVIIDHASSVISPPEKEQQELLFASATLAGLGEVEHREKLYDDFREELLIPHKYSQLGPTLCKGDMNGDGLDDLFIPGASGMASQLYMQQSNGSFVASSQPLLQAGTTREDVGAAMFDVDGDGDNDLLVVAGGNEHKLGSELLKPALYLNSGGGKLVDGSDRLPKMTVSGQRVLHADIDSDGDQDVFLGGRVTPGRYPISPTSYILRNDGGGTFTNATYDVCPDLMEPGMVTDGQFVDMNGDGDMDLVLVGEWMPISVYDNDGGKFTLVTDELGFIGTEGWWYSLLVHDLDGDGDMDLAAGNLGLNTKYHASAEEPFHVYLNDFDGTGTNDIVLALHQDEKLYPVRGRECSSEQMPFITEKFPTFESFSKATVADVYSPQNLNDAFKRVAYELRSCVFINNGNGFEKRVLPNRVQMAPVNCILAQDVNGDGDLDLTMAGNNHGAEVETVRYDAGTGVVLLGDGAGNYSALSPGESGLYAAGDVRDMCSLNTSQGAFVVVANNRNKLQCFRILDNQQLSALR